MKKLGIFFVFMFLAFGLVSAADMGVKNGTGVMHDEVIAAGGQNGTPTLYGEGIGAKTMLRSGNYINENGQAIRIQGDSNQMQLQVGEQTATCNDCNLSQEMIQNRVRISAQLSNGNQAEIKIMPDQASEKALERLRLNMCENCSIELKEVGNGASATMAYALKTKTKAKVFGIFNTNVDAEVEIDAGTGEVIRTKKPWWAVLQAADAE